MRGVLFDDLRAAITNPKTAGMSNIQSSSGRTFFHPVRGTHAMSDENAILVRRGIAQNAATPKPIAQLEVTFFRPPFHRMMVSDAMIAASVVMR